MFAGVLTLYSLSLSPSVGPTDSGELTLAAWTLGNAHPPGFPLYLLVTRGVMWLTSGTPAWRANFASALFGAAAAPLLALSTLALLRAARGSARRHDLIVAAAAGLLFGASRTIWNYATVAEVYSLAAMFMVGVWGSLVVWYRSASVRWLYAASLLFGAALAVHHVTIGLSAIAIAVLVIATRGVGYLKTKSAAISVALVLSGLLIYAYLPIVASRGIFMNWGNPHDFQRVVDHITGRQYRGYMSLEKAGTGFDFAMATLAREFGPVWLPLVLLAAIVGAVALWRRQRALFWFFVLIIAADIAWVSIYPIQNDRDAYLIPAAAALVLLAASASLFFDRIASAGVRIVAALALLTLPILSAASSWSDRDRSSYWISRDYATNALALTRPNALLLTGMWQLYGPLLALQETEGVRPDVSALDPGMLLQSWYLDAISLRHPQLARDVSKELADLRESVLLWEATSRERWATMSAEQAVLAERLNALLLAMIDAHLRRGPVYATRDVFYSPEPIWQPSVKAVADRYDVIPLAVVMECVPRGPSPPPLPPLPELQMRGLRESRDPVVVNEIVREYAAGFLTRARYLSILREDARALAEYDLALALEPDNVVIQRERRVLAARLGSP